MAEFRLETERLILREWRETDIAPLARMNRDREVMEFIGPLQSGEEAARMVANLRALQADYGHCYWALERRRDGAMIGFCGLDPGFVGPVKGEVEIGWRLAREAWGQGFAREAAQASLAWGFAELPRDRIWAKTVPANTRSWGLMRRLGMSYVEGGDFDHPALAEGDPLRRHVLYRIARPQ
jgi:RimJ/RimL family protein N-acetyltransferase